ncbi:hypothetical protein [Pseudomonas sp. AN-1]|uniref:DUF7210 family protein n=1 Tax=Pseudomonas sp. AN-1 TaxID=3096605 RepID=UPI002A69F449|nr:hypothetical protein [Pseudomonas sp. AN-1]WPP47093.1 hypothetical protein SK095_06800 [Pseudomonas sp. AN-1]
MATPTVKVTLSKPHTHAGKRYEKGAEIEVPRVDAEFLLRVKAIDKLPAAGKAEGSQPPATVVAHV